MQKAALLIYVIYPFKSTHYCMWDIDWKRLFRNVWIIEDMVNLPIFSCTLQPAIVRPWLTTWSTIVALISSDMRLCPWALLPLPLFCLCTLPRCILTPLLPLGCWPWSFSGCSSIIRICYFCVVPLFICFPIEGSWDAHLNYFREPVYNWLIYILFISESQDSLAQFMANLQKVVKKCVENMLDSLWQLDQPFCI